MAYHLLTYSLIFLPVVIALYQLCPARFRFVVLLAADYTFFCMISGKLLVWLLLATLVTYGTGRWLAAIPVRHSDLHGKALTRKKRGVLALGIVLILGALVTLKYLRVFGVTLAAPIGISYYSLQAISYMTDVYRGTQESCKNPIKVALYLSFFRRSWKVRSAGFPRQQMLCMVGTVFSLRIWSLVTSVSSGGCSRRW